MATAHKSYTIDNLVDDVARDCNITKKAAEPIVEAVFNSVYGKLEEHIDVYINGFGKFVIKQTKERPWKNPLSGEEGILPASYKLKFNPSAKLSESVK